MVSQPIMILLSALILSGAAGIGTMFGFNQDSTQPSAIATYGMPEP